MLKKLSWLTLAVAVLFSVSACGGKQNAATDNGDKPQAGSQEEIKSPDKSDSSGKQDAGDDADSGEIIDLPWEDGYEKPGNPYDWLDDEDDEPDVQFEHSFWDDNDYSQHGVMKPVSSVTVGDRVLIGRYNWIVLELKNGAALVICETSVDFMAFAGGEIHPTTWSNSGIRSWLNEGFYRDSFAADEKERIMDTDVINDSNPWFGIDGGANTKDKVFLLSIDEILTYFGDSGDLRSGKGKDAWVINDMYDQRRVTTYLDTDILTWWWLRSPGMNDIYSSCIGKDGCINVGGEYAGGGGGGVRPAIWFTLFDE